MNEEGSARKPVAILLSLFLWAGIVVGVLNMNAFGTGGPVPGPSAQCPGGSPAPTSSGSPTATRSGPLPSLTLPTGRPTSTPPASPTPTPGACEVESEVTIRYSKRKDAFKGRVRSDERGCERQRLVVLKKVKKGRDRTVGRDVTNRRGRWIEKGFHRPRGRYYSKATRKVFTSGGASVECRPARSRTIRP